MLAWPHASARHLAPLLLALLCGCGGQPAPASADPPPLEVVGRPSAFLVSSQAPTPLSQVWEFDGSDPEWAAPGPDAVLRDGRLQLTGRDAVGLVCPRNPPPDSGVRWAIDAGVHHWLSVRLATTTARALTVAWRGAGQAFEAGNTTSPMALEADGELHTYTLPLSELRGDEHAEDGVEAFMLRFTGVGELAVEVDQVALVSDFDAPALGTRALTHQGVLRRGAALPLPGTLACTLDDVRPGDRVRFGLALAAGDAALSVTIRGPDGAPLCPPARLEPGLGWQEHEVALPDVRGSFTLTLGADERAGTLGTLLLGGVLHLRPASAPAPDVLLYVVDTLRADRLGLLGHNRPTDPHLTAIAGDGVSFDRLLSASNWTRPSMSSLLTSLDPLAHGNQIHGRRVPESAETLAEVLAAAGWRTVAFVTNFHAGDWSGLAQGFDVYAGPLHEGAYKVASTQTSDLVADWLDAELEPTGLPRVKTFMLVLTLDPHEPYEPGAADLAALGFARGDNADAPPPAPDLAYDAEIRHNDGNLARLDIALARAGRTADTLLMITADHGEAFGEHGQFEHRRSLHQEEVHVPWVLRWPGRLPAGTRLDAPVTHIDVAPTLLGLLGLDAPASWLGRSHSDWLTGAGGPPPRDRPLFIDAVYRPEDGTPYLHELAVIVPPYKLITHIESDGRVLPHALFDLDADPTEQHNLLRDHAVATVIEGLLAQARDLVARGRVLPEQGSLSTDMDPIMRRWMAEMGYLK